MNTTGSVNQCLLTLISRLNDGSDKGVLTCSCSATEESTAAVVLTGEHASYYTAVTREKKAMARPPLSLNLTMCHSAHRQESRKLFFGINGGVYGVWSSLLYVCIHIV